MGFLGPALLVGGVGSLLLAVAGVLSWERAGWLFLVIVLGADLVDRLVERRRTTIRNDRG
jgi:hypothetical protein